MVRRSLMLACGSVLSLTCLALADTTVLTPSKDVTIRIEVQKPPHPQPMGEADVQIALLLDTSNSMDGLINQARTQLWKIVNELNKAQRDGKMPRLQVALYEYGNNNLSAGEGYIRMVLPLTNDLDKVSEELWKLSTNGGSEYCGQVIHEAAEGLTWSADPKVYKAIFIAGNEPFTQGEFDYHKGVAQAVGRGVVVNTIHCGPRQEGERGMWADGARLGEGKFLTIDQDRVQVQIKTPCDEVIIKLSGDLNSTYIPYGKDGEFGCARQIAQDANAAAAAPEVAAARAVSKASANYQNASWDFVDATCNAKTVKFEDADMSQLPEAYRNLTREQLKTKVEELAKRRVELQAQIAKLNAERDQYIQDELKKAAGPTTQPDTLDTATLAIVREQLQAKGFEVK
ncbi:MAG: vWA domain-containing protein [Tepidisphaeraceae bacterium]